MMGWFLLFLLYVVFFQLWIMVFFFFFFGEVLCLGESDPPVEFRVRPVRLL